MLFHGATVCILGIVLNIIFPAGKTDTPAVIEVD